MPTALERMGVAMSGYANSPQGQRTLNLAFGLPSDVAANVQQEREYFRNLENEQMVKDIVGSLGNQPISDDQIMLAAQASPELALNLRDMQMQQRKREALAGMSINDPALPDILLQQGDVKGAKDIIQQQRLLAEQQMLQDYLMGGAGVAEGGSDLAPYVMQSSDNPLLQGIGEGLVEQRKIEQQTQRDIEKESRKLQMDIEKEKRAPNQTQSNSFAFGTRMADAENNLSGIDSVLADGKQAALGSLPGGNYIVSDEYQLAQQAARDWVTANLRKESGAAIPPEEMEQEIKKYFPQPGDSASVIEQKRQSRANAYKGMKKSAGSLSEDMAEYSIGQKNNADLNMLRQQAQEAIAAGVDPSAVAAEFQRMTGEAL